MLNGHPLATCLIVSNVRIFPRIGSQLSDRVFRWPFRVWAREVIRDQISDFIAGTCRIQQRHIGTGEALALESRDDSVPESLGGALLAAADGTGNYRRCGPRYQGGNSS